MTAVYTQTTIRCPICGGRAHVRFILDPGTHRPTGYTANCRVCPATGDMGWGREQQPEREEMSPHATDPTAV